MHNSDVGRAEIHSRKSEWEEIKLQMWAILVEEKEEYRSLDGEEKKNGFVTLPGKGGTQ